MLNPFPELLMLSTLAPLILRVALGVFFVYLGISLWKKRKEVTTLLTPLFGKSAGGMPGLLLCVHGALGVLLIIGLYTQIAALIAFGISIKLLFVGKFQTLSPFGQATYLLLAAIALSLLLSGAGAFAFDIPL